MSPRIPSILIAVVLALPLLSSDAMPAQGKGPEKMELYTAGDNTFALYKPPGWKVDSRAVENGKVVTVSDPKGGSRAVMRILSMQDRRENSTTLVSRTLKDLRATVSGLDLAWARSTEDRPPRGDRIPVHRQPKEPDEGPVLFQHAIPRCHGIRLRGNREGDRETKAPFALGAREFHDP